MYERRYEVEIATVDENRFFARVYQDLEDTLLLLRLFRVGDVVFFDHTLQQPSGQTLSKYPERIISDYFSTSHYVLSQSDLEDWNRFAQRLMGKPAWNSTWFGIARRFFLYGGSKEFNADYDQVDRIIDYMIALEAVLVPEGDGGFLKRRVQKRGNALCPEASEMLLGKFYDIRSTIAHGSALGIEHRETLRNMQAFEAAVRKILATSLSEVPASEDGRKAKLVSLYDPSDAEREQKAIEDFERTVKKRQRRPVLNKLAAKYGAGITSSRSRNK
jgi:hypothetical protein